MPVCLRKETAMKKNFAFLLLLALALCGCTKPADKDKQVVARINNYEITKDEFNAEFQASPYSRSDTLDSRKEFLNTLINRKLILQDAEAKGLDEDKDFLKMVEHFWEQSLLKLVLDRESKEIAGAVMVTDKEIEALYSKLKTEGKTDKTYDALYSQLKWELTRIKETRMLADWLSALRNKSDIRLNLELIKENK